MLDQKQLVELGARALITTIGEQLADVLREMPELRPFAEGAFRAALITSSNGNGKAHKAANEIARPDDAPTKRKRRPRTAAEKKEMSKRMRAYWAARRTEKKG